MDLFARVSRQIKTVGHLIPNPLYTYILNTWDLVWVGCYGISIIVGY